MPQNNQRLSKDSTPGCLPKCSWHGLAWRHVFDGVLAWRRLIRVSQFFFSFIPVLSYSFFLDGASAMASSPPSPPCQLCQPLLQQQIKPRINPLSSAAWFWTLTIVCTCIGWDVLADESPALFLDPDAAAVPLLLPSPRSVAGWAMPIFKWCHVFTFSKWVGIWGMP